MTIHHHIITNHRQQAPHLQQMIRHTETQPYMYHTYQITLIQTQVHRIILRQNHWTLGILNEHDVRI